MLLETASGVLSLINLAINTGKNVYGLVTGIRSRNSIDEVGNRLQKIENQLYYLNSTEVRNTSLKEQHIYRDFNQIGKLLVPDLNVLGNAVYCDTIQTPDRLRSIMVENPREILHGITALHDWQQQMQLLKDPYWVPITFQENNEKYIGWMKSGYAKDYFKIEYTPKQGLILPNKTEDIFVKKDKFFDGLFKLIDDKSEHPFVTIINHEKELNNESYRGTLEDVGFSMIYATILFDDSHDDGSLIIGDRGVFYFEKDEIIVLYYTEFQKMNFNLHNRIIYINGEASINISRSPLPLDWIYHMLLNIQLLTRDYFAGMF